MSKLYSLFRGYFEISVFVISRVDYINQVCSVLMPSVMSNTGVRKICYTIFHLISALCAKLSRMAVEI